MHCLGRIPPAEAETEYYDQLDASQPAGSQNLEGASNSGWFSFRGYSLQNNCTLGAQPLAHRRDLRDEYRNRHDTPRKRTNIWLAAAARDEFAGAECLPSSLKAFDR
jgi:putative transposase